MVKTIKHGNVFVTGQQYVGMIKRMFADEGFKVVESVKESDYVCIAGGDDIHPQIYGEKPIPGCYPNVSQDERDCSVYSLAINDRYIIGICRGGQLINCLNGGKMWQHSDNHEVGSHNITDMITGEYLSVNTLHHQQMIAGQDGEVVAFSTVSNFKARENDIWHRTKGDVDMKDVEVVFYPATNSLCFQPHPEFTHKTTRKYFFDLIDRYMQPF